MDGKQTMLRGLAGIVSLGLLLALWASQAIGGSLLLLALGTLALLAYLGNRAGQGTLLAPAGLMLGLGSGLAVSDLAHGTSLAGPGMVVLFGLGLLGVYMVEREHAWALAFGALLLLGGFGWLVITVLTHGPWLVGIGVAVFVSIASGRAVSRRPAPISNLAMIEMSATRIRGMGR